MKRLSKQQYIAIALIALMFTACDLTPTPQPPNGPTSSAGTQIPGINTIVVAPTDTPVVIVATGTPPPESSPITIEIPGTQPTSAVTSGPVTGCTPTQADGEGPFYKPDAPQRASIGEGHILRGVVKRSSDCQPLAGAKIEFWQVNSNAEYDDAHRATLYANAVGEYTFESNFPPGYEGRPPHIHLKVSVDGYRTFTTQFYPKQGETEATFDLALVP
ncbi:MAG: hypothetical protein ABIO92_01595 [Chloroflexia bacterium]